MPSIADRLTDHTVSRPIQSLYLCFLFLPNFHQVSTLHSLQTTAKTISLAFRGLLRLLLCPPQESCRFLSTSTHSSSQPIANPPFLVSGKPGPTTVIASCLPRQYGRRVFLFFFFGAVQKLPSVASSSFENCKPVQCRQQSLHCTKSQTTHLNA